METDREMHHSLAAYIKNVHSVLRRRLTEGTSPEKVWEEHVSEDGTDVELRQQYAIAMQSLATEHWDDDEHSNSRIQWIVKATTEYFYGKVILGGEPQLKKIKSDCAEVFDQSGFFISIAKDTRRSLFVNGLIYKEKDSGGIVLNNAETEYINEQVKLRWQKCLGTSMGGCLDANIEQESSCEKLDQKLKLLDVGSCFDPFSKFSKLFETNAIDITPACEAVAQLDFVTSTIGTTDEYDLIENSYQVVVFSLLLEYLPSSDLRWICCMKANHVLRLDGILCIVTPDSSHVNKRASQMKSWKKALEHLGFKRWRYEKLQHLHCMVFRKVDQVSKPKDKISVELTSLLYIPQDHNQSNISKL